MRSVNSKCVVNLLQEKLGKETTIEIVSWSEPQGAGASSGVALFSARINNELGRYVLRYDPGEGFYQFPNIAHEFRVLKKFNETNVPAPKVYWLDDVGEFLETPGMIMEQVEGSPAEMAVFRKGALAEASPTQREQMIMDVVRALAELHAINPVNHDFDFLARRGEGSTPVERDLNWTWQQLRWARPDMCSIMQPYYDWLLNNQPRLSRICVCHGDPNLTNVMFNNSKLSALLDWELAHFGAAETDLAYFLLTTEVYQLGRERADGCPSNDFIMQYYFDCSGADLNDWNYYSALACYRVTTWVLMSMRDWSEAQREGQAGFTGFFFDRLSSLTH